MKYDFDPVPLSAPDPMGLAEMLPRATQHYEFVSRRRTVRHFSSQPISREIIEVCIRTAGSAPSGANHQPWHFACVSDPQIKHQIRLAAEAEERANPPAVGRSQHRGHHARGRRPAGEGCRRAGVHRCAQETQ